MPLRHSHPMPTSAPPNPAPCTVDMAGMADPAQAVDDLIQAPLRIQGCTSLEHLPDGMKIRKYPLILAGCTALKDLPDNLEVGQHLDLEGCTALEALPENLKVGSDLILRGCTAWNGQIPEGVRVRGGYIITDAHPKGITLKVWRDLHPRGERA